MLNLHKIPHILPTWAMGVYCVYFGESWPFLRRIYLWFWAAIFIHIWTCCHGLEENLLMFRYVGILASLLILLFVVIFNVTINQVPFSISYLEAQVTWNFAFNSLDHFLSSPQVTWKPSYVAKSQVTLVDDLRYLGLLWHHYLYFVSFQIQIQISCDSLWYVSQYMYERQSIFCWMINQLCVWCLRLRQHCQIKFFHRLLWCCIQWCHNSVDIWHHNSIDTDAWGCQQPMIRRTIGGVPK